MPRSKIGLLLGDEDDWPRTLEALLAKLGNRVSYRGESWDIAIEAIRISPFELRAPSSYQLVIDRLAYWHQNPREWLKKAALIDRVYLLNNPFTFQSMEKHSAYCAAIRLGLSIPETWLIPTKAPIEGKKFEVTARRYHDWFDLPGIAKGMGYPLYMKPFDGGGWRDVTRVGGDAELMRAYDGSGRVMMHLQAGLTDYDVFVRSLGIGPQTLSLRFEPDQPLHARYAIDDQAASPETLNEARALVKLVNAFFCWDFNSCETILKGGTLWPIDFANACPDIALTSLHYYYPWAIKALLGWSLYCAVSGRRMRINMDVEPYFEIADSERTYAEKVVAYERLADAHFESEAFEEFRATSLASLDEAMWELCGSQPFDDILVETVKGLFPAHEHEAFVAHFRGLIARFRASEAG